MKTSVLQPCASRPMDREAGICATAILTEYQACAFLASIIQNASLSAARGFIYLEHGLALYNSDDAANHVGRVAAHDRRSAPRGAGQLFDGSNQVFDAGYKGYSIHHRGFGGLLISGKKIFPRYD
ncbi:hypothetical protein QM150_00440 [Klebsiella pneumoniae]